MTIREYRINIPESQHPSDKKAEKTGKEYKYGNRLADAISDMLDEAGLITVSHTYPTYTSRYTWDGQRVQRDERPLIVRADPKNYEKISRIVHELHPYETVPISEQGYNPADPVYDAWNHGGSQDSGPVPGG